MKKIAISVGVTLMILIVYPVVPSSIKGKEGDTVNKE